MTPALRRVAVTGLAAWLLAGCGGGTTPTVDPGADPPSAASDTASDTGSDGVVDLPACPGFDSPRTYVPPPEDQPPTDPAITSPELFPDIAITDGGDPGDAHVGDGMSAFGAAREWATAEASEHFAGIWVDGRHNAAVIAFTDEVERHAAEVRERFGAGWWVVEADHSYAELELVLADLRQEQDAGFADVEDGRTPPGTVVGTAVLEDRQLVEVMVVGGDEEVLTALADRFDHPAICFAVLPPPPTYDPDGEVRTLAAAAGWRDDLGPEETVDGWLEVAYDADVGERAFAENVPGDLPAGDGDPAEDALHAGFETVDWDREVLVVWSSGRSGSCPVWVDDLRTSAGTVEISTASPVGGFCTDDWNPFRTVLAVDRDRLPDPGDLPLPVGEGWAGGGRAVPYPAG